MLCLPEWRILSSCHVWGGQDQGGFDRPGAVEVPLGVKRNENVLFWYKYVVISDFLNMSEYSKTSQLSMTFSFSESLVDDITYPSSLSQGLVDSQDSGYAVHTNQPPPAHLLFPPWRTLSPPSYLAKPCPAPARRRQVQVWWQTGVREVSIREGPPTASYWIVKNSS